MRKIIHASRGNQTIHRKCVNCLVHAVAMNMGRRVAMASRMFCYGQGLAIVAIVGMRYGWINDHVRMARHARHTARELRREVHAPHSSDQRRKGGHWTINHVCSFLEWSRSADLIFLTLGAPAQTLLRLLIASECSMRTVGSDHAAAWP